MDWHTFAGISGVTVASVLVATLRIGHYLGKLEASVAHAVKSITELTERFRHHTDSEHPKRDDAVHEVEKGLAVLRERSHSRITLDEGE